MQDKEFNELDLLFRSALQDAEEKAPRRVWSAVRRDLRAAGAAASSTRPAAAWPRRAAVALAVAGALAAALVLPKAFNRGSADVDLLAEAAKAPAVQEVAPVAGIHPEAVEDAPVVTDVTAPRTVSHRTAQTVKSDVQPAAEPVAAESVQEQSAPVSVAVEHPENESTAVNSDPSHIQDSVESTVEAKKAVTADPFSLLAAEDEREDSRRKIAITAGGLVGTNDHTGSGHTGGIVFSAPSTSSGLTNKISESGESTFDIPVSAGIGVRMYLTDRLALGTGIRYTRLSRVFEGVYTDTNVSGITMNTVKDDIRNTQDYIGVPVLLSYDLVSKSAFSTYTYFSTAVDKALSNKFHVPGVSTLKGDTNGLQWSVGAGFGIGFRITDFLGVYVDPGVVYYFDCDQPKSIWTQQRLQMRFETGLRFNL